MTRRTPPLRSWPLRFTTRSDALEAAKLIAKLSSATEIEGDKPAGVQVELPSSAATEQKQAWDDMLLQQKEAFAEFQAECKAQQDRLLLSIASTTFRSQWMQMIEQKLLQDVDLLQWRRKKSSGKLFSMSACLAAQSADQQLAPSTERSWDKLGEAASELVERLAATRHAKAAEV